jgi:inositol transporter-like SP family MFS transporter
MHATQEAKRQVNPWWIAIVCGMASYIDAAAIVSSGTALVLYQHSIGVTEGQIGVLSAMLTLAIAAGAVSGGRLGDRFGRRAVFVATMTMVVIGAGILVAAPGFVGLLIGTIVLGLGSGADLPVSLATISEAAPEDTRGRLVGFSQILWFGGILGANLVSAIAGGWGQVGGQVMYAHVGVVALVVLLLRLTVPESRTWSDARREKESGAATIRAQRTGIRDVLGQKAFRVPLVALLVFYTLTNIGANTGGQFNQFIAVNVVGISVQTQSLIGIGSQVIGVAGAAVFMRIVDGPHRMAFYIFGAVCLVFSYLTPVLFGFTIAPWLVNSAVNAIGGAFAFEAIMKVWAQESFPTLLRSSVQGFVIAFARVVAALVALVTPVLMHTPNLAYLLIAIIVAIGLVAGWLGFHRSRFDAFEEETEMVAPREEVGVR